MYWCFVFFLNLDFAMLPLPQLKFLFRMEFKIITKATKTSTIFIIDQEEQLSTISSLSKEEIAFAQQQLKNGSSAIHFNQISNQVFIYNIKDKASTWQTDEMLRKAGADLCLQCNKWKQKDILINNLSGKSNAAYLIAEGMSLSNYQFLKYRSDAAKAANSLQQILFNKQSITLKEINQLSATYKAVEHARNLVNEPLNYLSAVQLAKEISTLGKSYGFKVTTLNKAQIEKEKMGGLLAVNRGSQQPPTFSIMEYKPVKSMNKKPIVLVGKGIVYDTGGLSLKPTPASMDRMKSDMSGAALVTGVMCAIATLKLPLHVIALVPATDNRPGENAYVPGDIITMYSGTTVEVLNTDAEGRLILGDALHYAKRFKPELVLDFATLTGAASAAIGEHGIVCMGKVDDTIKNKIFNSGKQQYERLVEFPLWDEYGDMIKSDFADLKNIGGPTGGAITAGKFLEHFTDYPWMHFDIAGVSFSMSKRNYIPSGGTAYGLRMVLDFLNNYSKPAID